MCAVWNEVCHKRSACCVRAMLLPFRVAQSHGKLGGSVACTRSLIGGRAVVLSLSKAPPGACTSTVHVARCRGGARCLETGGNLWVPVAKRLAPPLQSLTAGRIHHCVLGTRCGDTMHSLSQAAPAIVTAEARGVGWERCTENARLPPSVSRFSGLAMRGIIIASYCGGCAVL